MKTNILTLLNEIDDTMIKNAEIKGANAIARPKRNWMKIVGVAACLALIVGIGSVITSKYLNNQGTEHLDFVVENGVLKQYVGNDSNVIIPDSVTKISNVAFDNSPKIQTLEIGSNVSEIEQMSFSALSSLHTITVNPKNNIFEVVNDVLIKKDGTLVFASIGANKDRNADEILMEVLETMKTNDIPINSLERIEVGKAVLYCESIKTDDNIFPFVKTIEAFGQTVSFEKEHLRLEGNLKFQAFETDECFVVASVDNSGVGETVIISEKSVFRVETPTNDSDKEYNRSIITFFEENGKLCYDRIPKKFYNIQAAGGVFEKCVSVDEFYKETGYIDVKDGKILYYPQLVITVSQGFDLESEYQKWSETVGGDMPTMIEYLENNKKAYEAAK